MTNKAIIAVTNRKLSTRPFLEQIERIAEQNPKAIILREKDLPEEEYETLAKEVFSICQKYNIELIVHNYPAVARKLGIKKLHLPLGELRKFGEEHIADKIAVENNILQLDVPEKKTAGKLEIGCSIHSIEEAKEAQQLGASYLTAGHIYATTCKPDIPPRGLNFLKEVCQAVTIPVYAIGGIGLSDGRIEEVAEAGAAGACIMSEFMKI